MINLDGDSSEEDEQIDDTGINNGPELMKEPATSILGKRALLLTEEVEEEDEPMIDNRIPQLISSSKFGETETMDLTASPEFAEARTAILEDPWDISSWMIYLEEIENHHGGSTSFESACMEFLQYFPRCAKIWQKLGQYFSNAGDFQEAEKNLLNGAKQCWSVELWVCLLSFMMNQSSLSRPNDDELAAAVARCENAFELSLSQVGLAIDSYDIWKLYVEFVSEWPSNNALDRSKKVSTLRKIYQRVLCTAIDQLDEFWNAYKAFERDVNGDQAEAYFGELNRRLGHSRTILKDRKEKIKQISFDRFSTPPTNSSSELEQLERWSQWMR
jgi:tetratricopeptide (TPR) repeat protein